MNTGPDFVVVDVETSGFDPIVARVLSVAALTLTSDGSIEHSMYTLLNPGVDPGRPTSTA
jgi:DNA polymerase-3 subunit epsilon